MTKKTRTVYKSETASNINTNGAREITGAVDKANRDDLADSAFFLDSDDITDITGVPTISSGDAGKSLVVNDDEDGFDLSDEVSYTNAQIDTAISSAISAIASVTSDDVGNDSGVDGDDVTAALNWLNTNKANGTALANLALELIDRYSENIYRVPTESSNVFTVSSASEGKLSFISYPKMLLLKFTSSEGLPTIGATLVIDALSATNLYNTNGGDISDISEGTYLAIYNDSGGYRLLGVDTGSGTGDVSYFEQPFTSSTSVVVTHNFGAFPLVNVLNSSDEVVVPLSITHNSSNHFTVTFTTATTGTVICNYGAPRAEPFSQKTSAYTLTSSDKTIECTSGTFDVTLPTAVGHNRVYIVKNSGAGTITMATTSSQTIDGAASGTLDLSQYDSYTFQSNGTNWIII